MNSKPPSKPYSKSSGSTHKGKKPFNKKPSGADSSRGKPFKRDEKDKKFKSHGNKPFKRDASRGDSSRGGKSSYKKPFNRDDKRKPSRFKEEAPAPQGMPVIITAIDSDGELYGLPEDAALVGEYPRLRLEVKAASGIPAPTVGDVVLVSDPKPDASAEDNITFLAAVIGAPQPEAAPQTFIGEFNQEGGFMYVRPMQKELSGLTFRVEKMPDAAPAPEDIVRARTMPEKNKGHKPANGSIPVEILEVLGQNPKGLASMIAIENFNIRMDWPEDVIASAEALEKTLPDADIAAREDLRKLPIVTIDGADAKDFDDAVWAEPEGDGFHIVVAIADVAHYVQPESPLDIEAQQRGNSTYFPDMVVPMLPERLSNDLCSLRPHEDRPVLVAHLHINSHGSLTKYTFSRAMIHSHARLTYEQAQAALDGNADDTAKPVLESTLKPLFNAYQVLLEARKKRHSIDLDIPESTLELNENGEVANVGIRDRLDTHKLIEEMMILANVAAARGLGSKAAPCLYRIHPEPDNKKLENLQSILKPHGIGLKTNSPTQQDYSKIVEAVHGHPAQAMLMKSILQSQMQAKYSTDNVGHYGLALSDYAHFTSPIRRYADLTVHRHLIEFHKLAGSGGVNVPERELEKAATSINDTERRSQKAEWEARDRLMTKYYAEFVGQKFTATVVTIMKYGCFVSIDNGIAEGLLPMRLMKDDHYIHDANQNMLIGKKTKRKINVGSQIEVILKQADRVEGRLTFSF